MAFTCASNISSAATITVKLIFSHRLRVDLIKYASISQHNSLTAGQSILEKLAYDAYLTTKDPARATEHAWPRLPPEGPLLVEGGWSDAKPTLSWDSGIQE